MSSCSTTFVWHGHLLRSLLHFFAKVLFCLRTRTILCTLDIIWYLISLYGIVAPFVKLNILSGVYSMSHFRVWLLEWRYNYTILKILWQRFKHVSTVVSELCSRNYKKLFKFFPNCVKHSWDMKKRPSLCGDSVPCSWQG